MAHELRPVGDHEQRAAFAKPFDRLGHETGVHRVEVRGRLVEDHERSFAQEGARQRHAAPLAGRERSPAVSDNGVVTLRQPGHERVRSGEGRCVPNLLVPRGRDAEPDVVGD